MSWTERKIQDVEVLETKGGNMITVTKQHRAAIAHRLPNHPGKCKFLHGHEYLFEITVKVSRNHPTADIQGIDEETGMVFDFKSLKLVIENVIGPWDHSLILWEDDPLLEAFGFPGQNLIKFPSIPTAENMAVEIATKLHQELNSYYLVVESVKVWETSTSYAEWRKQ